MVGIFLLPAHSAFPQANQSTTAAPSSSTLSLDEVIKLIKENKKDLRQVSSIVSDRGVNFELDEKAKKRLQKAGANDELMADIWKVTPSGKAHMRALLTTPSGVEVQASAEEALALEEIQNESDADRSLRMADEFEKKFPNSPLLSYIYTAAAKAQQDKGDLDAAIAAARKSLTLDSDNTFSLIILALVLPQPKELQGSPSEVREHLREAETDAKQALTLLEKLKQRTGETDEQFKQRKGALAADAHFALGMVATQQNQFEQALTEYQAAISSTSKPTFQYYYRLAEAYASIGQVSEAIKTLQEASELARGTPMQKYADDFIAELQKKPH